jgi:hypothetical protein
MTGYELFSFALRYLILSCVLLPFWQMTQMTPTSTLYATLAGSVTENDSLSFVRSPRHCQLSSSALSQFFLLAKQEKVLSSNLDSVSTKQAPAASFESTLLFTMANNNPPAPIDFNGITLAPQNDPDRGFLMGSYTDTVTPAYRELLAGEELTKFHEKATSTLKTIYSLSWASLNPQTEAAKDFFDHTNKIIHNAFALRTHMQSFCLGSVFQIFPVDDLGNLDPTGAFINLLESPTITSEFRVRMSNRIYAERSTDRLHPQNLAWTQELLLNSCDSTFRSDIEARLMNIPDNEQGGALIYHMLLNSLISSTSEASRGVVRKLESLSVTDFAGENIHNFCATFNNVVLRLGLCGATPTDLAGIFLERLQTCTVDEFRSLLTTLKNIRDPLLRDYVRLKDRVTERYQELLLSHHWLPTSKDGSYNQATNEKPDPAKDPAKRPPIDRTPPGPGEPNKRRRHDNKGWIYWCGKCWNGVDTNGRWGNHSTERHANTKWGRAGADAATTPPAGTPGTPTANLGTVNPPVVTPPIASPPAITPPVPVPPPTGAAANAAQMITSSATRHFL